MTRVHYLDHTTSTQDVLHQLASDGAPTGTAVVAAEQSSGRGSRGRIWHSPRGGLWLSVLLRPAGSIGLEVLSLRAGLAVADVLAMIPELPVVGLKWPNDLMLVDRKVGGVLCEARWQGETLAWVAVGLGVNVSNPLPSDMTQAATRLVDYQVNLAPPILVEPIVRAITAIADRGELFDAAELTAFAARDWLRGRVIEAPVAGRGAGIARDGTLIVRMQDGQNRQVRSGTVVLGNRSF